MRVLTALFLRYRIISVTGATEEVLGDFGIGQDVACVTGVNYLAARHDVTAIRAGKREACVLLNYEDGDALLAQRIYPVDNLLLVQRREGSCGLVQQ